MLNLEPDASLWMLIDLICWLVGFSMNPFYPAGVVVMASKQTNLLWEYLKSKRQVPYFSFFGTAGHSVVLNGE